MNPCFRLIALLAVTGALGVDPAPAATSSDVMIGVNHNMHATLIAPDGPGPYPGVLVLHTSSGLTSADIQFAQRLAEQGYVCLVPKFMEAYRITPQGRAATFTTYAAQIYADLADGLELLRGNDKVKGARLGAVGFSNGGYFTAWLAETGKVQAGIAYYAALSGAGTDRALSRFQSVASAGGAPLLILHGSNDSTVPIAHAEHLAAILAAAHAPYEFHRYDSAGHGFDRKGENAEAAADAWQRTLAFFDLHLKHP